MGVEGREKDPQAPNLRMVREEMGAALGASQEGPRFRDSTKAVVVVGSTLASSVILRLVSL